MSALGFTDASPRFHRLLVDIAGQPPRARPAECSRARLRVLISVGAVLELLPREQGTIRLLRLDTKDAEDYAEGAEDDLVKQFGHLPFDRYTPEVVRQQINDFIDPRGGRTLAVQAIADVESDNFVVSKSCSTSRVNKPKLATGYVQGTRSRLGDRCGGRTG